MNKPLNHDSIAKAMKEAAWVAKHGTREERSGRFIPHKSKPAIGQQRSNTPRRES